MTGANQETYAGSTVLVVGAAKSGLAAAGFLLSHGARVILTDKKSPEALATAIAPLHKLSGAADRLHLELGEHRPESFGRCDLVVVSPGVPVSLPVFAESRKAGIPIIGEVELAYRHLKGKILGITGSNGKTTTTALVSELLCGAGLKGHIAGNIGAPLIGYADRSCEDDIYATELSSFQLETIQEFRPCAGAILNLTPDHLDRYSGFEDYVSAKRRIFLNQRITDFAVLNADDPRTAAMAAEVSATPVLFSRLREVERGTFIRDGCVCYRREEFEKVLFPVSEIRLRGNHNLENVLAACALAILAGADSLSFGATIRDFRGVEHRIEWVAEIAGVPYFNDSKATNVDATIKSLEAFPGNICLIAGGRDKAGDFSALRTLVRERVKYLVLIGEAAGKIRSALSDLTETRDAASMADAVKMCRRAARPGDVVLLAPACASFDMFDNYEHRGRVFKQAVHALEESPTS